MLKKEKKAQNIVAELGNCNVTQIPLVFITTAVCTYWCGIQCVYCCLGLPHWCWELGENGSLAMCPFVLRTASTWG